VTDPRNPGEKTSRSRRLSTASHRNRSISAPSDCKAAKRSVGRPSSYREEYAEQARKLCLLLGATDKELADFFEVEEKTINNWKAAHPKFREALLEGKTKADARVARRLYDRAMGWEHEAVKIFRVEEPERGPDGEILLDRDGRPIMVSKGLYLPYTERFPPDVGAQRLWLTNRQPRRWRNRQDVSVEGSFTLADVVARSFQLEKEREGEMSPSQHSRVTS
jgi:hypothetical protein